MAIVDGNGCVGVRRSPNYTCLGERIDAVDSTRQACNSFIHKCKNAKSPHLV
jgi:hypothetical protein